jgi:hypothetical protein
MNDLQGLFSVVFGIYFAATVSAVARFQVFDTTAALAGDARASVRTLLGILFLDIVPFLYYVVILASLAGSQSRLLNAWVPGFGVLFAGLGGFGIYRIFVAVLVLRRGRTDDKLLLYSDPVELKSEIAKSHAARHRPEHALPGESLPTFLGGIIWIGMCLSIFLLAT